MKKVFSAIMVLAIVLTMLPLGLIMSSALTSGDYFYEVIDAKAKITRYIGDGGNVSIPSELGGYPVTEIGASAFAYRDTLTSVSFPDSVTVICANAFQECTALWRISFGDGVAYIGDSAFALCHSLESVTIGSGLASIGSNPFQRCYYLTQILVDSRNTSFSSQNGVLLNKGLTILYIYPAGKTGAYEIPDGVTDIKDSAFSGCLYLTSLYFPASVSSIAENAFFCCNRLTSVAVNSGNASFLSQDGVLFNKTITTLLFCERDKTGNYAIPSTISSICIYAFMNCIITGVTIPDSVKVIGTGAFYGCAYLVTADLGNGLNIIGDKAFDACYLMNNVTIPASVTSIGVCAFYCCYAFTEVNIPDGVISIGNSAFEFCTELVTVTIANSVTSIGRAAFRYCSKLASVNIPDRLTVIEQQTFDNCIGLTDVMIPDSVETIGNQAFNNCKELETVKFGYNLASVGIYGFSYCKKLTSVTLPGRLTKLEYGAFSVCPLLTGAYFLGNAPEMGDCVFQGSASGFTVYYLSNKTGFTNPWYGYSTEIFGDVMITFDSNGGTGGSENFMDFGEVITPPAVAKTGYVFTGWSAAVPATAGLEDAIFTAQWNLLGDIGSDGQISVIDALMALQASSGIFSLNANQLLYADVNHDSNVSSIDALMVLQYASGKITSF